MNEEIIVFGTGQLADVAWYYLTHFSPYRIAAYTVEQGHLTDRVFRNRPVVPFEEVQDLYPPQGYRMLVFVSYRQVNRLRERLYTQAHEKGYSFISYVHPDTRYHADDIGVNTFILENNTIQPFTVIGANTIIWSSNHIGHHTKIGHHVFIASEVCISGGVTIGDRTFIGVGATIRDNVVIGENCVIGAGATVMKDLPPASVIVPPRSVILKKKSYELRGL